MASPLYRVLDAGTTASGAVCDVGIGESSFVDNPVSTVNNSAEMPESSAHAVDNLAYNSTEMPESSAVDYPANNSASVDVDLEDNVSVPALDEIGLEVNANVVNGYSYAARTAGLRESPRSFSVHNNAANELPDRPRSAFFTPSRSTSARSVFDALRLAEIESQEVACMQRRMDGEVIITFKRPSSKEKFLRLNALKIGTDNYAIHDFVSFVFDIPECIKHGPGVWKLNNSLLSDEKFCKLIRGTILEQLLIIFKLGGIS